MVRRRGLSVRQSLADEKADCIRPEISQTTSYTLRTGTGIIMSTAEQQVVETFRDKWSVS